MNNNFAWTITDEKGNLLAYQEKGKDAQVQIIDLEKAKQRCKDLVIEAMENTTLDELPQLQAIGVVMYTWRRLLGLEDQKKPKSNLILPGDKNFNSGIVK